MEKMVMIRIVEGFNPFTVLDDIRSIGFQLDHLIPAGKIGLGLVLVGSMEISSIMMLKCFDGVASFKITNGISTFDYKY